MQHIYKSEQQISYVDDYFQLLIHFKGRQIILSEDRICVCVCVLICTPTQTYTHTHIYTHYSELHRYYNLRTPQGANCSSAWTKHNQFTDVYDGDEIKDTGNYKDRRLKNKLDKVEKMGIEYENEQSTDKRLSKCYKTYTYITRIDNMLRLKQEAHLKAKSTTKGLADNM